MKEENPMDEINCEECSKCKKEMIEGENGFFCMCEINKTESKCIEDELKNYSKDPTKYDIILENLLADCIKIMEYKKNVQQNYEIQQSNPNTKD